MGDVAASGGITSHVMQIKYLHQTVQLQDQLVFLVYF